MTREADSERASRGTVAGLGDGSRRSRRGGKNTAGGVGHAQLALASEERNERGGEQ